ncbi:hypothetical protein DSO57_1013295 [Entomophthora muscae]|uniref:Uncharacterized protein n=1 Tax=Entomophthora muscae TaxID=34485 RepID=A0ACC2SUY0_9FUNG|nr:hypothetical protein DSO57_1013295 [Entomophthora muscae]
MVTTQSIEERSKLDLFEKGVKRVSELLWGKTEFIENKVGPVPPKPTESFPEPLQSKPFDFEEWLNRDPNPTTPSKEQIERDRVKYSKIWRTHLYEAPKIEKSHAPAETFPTHVPPKIRHSPEQSDPEVFDVKTWYPSYLLSGIKDEASTARALNEKPLSFNINYSLPQYDEFVRLEQTNLENYCDELVKWSLANCKESDQQWELKETFLKSLIVYQNYKKFLLPTFRNNPLLAAYVDVIRKRIYGLTQSLASNPGSYETCVAELEHLFNQVSNDNAQAYTLVLHYLSHLILSYIELPEEDSADRFIWLRLIAWLYGLQIGTSNEILVAHFMHRCPQTAGLTFIYAEDMTECELKKYWVYKPKSYLQNLKRELSAHVIPPYLSPSCYSLNNRPLPSFPLEDDSQDCFKTDDITFSDEEDLNSADNVVNSERSPSLSELGIGFAPEGSKFADVSFSESVGSGFFADLKSKINPGKASDSSSSQAQESLEVELESNEEYAVRMTRLFHAFEFLRTVQCL